jgi:hypothetical protein
MGTSIMDTLQPDAWLWNDMIEEFRSLGGTADNVVQRLGRYGYGLFPQDPAKPVDIHVPAKLLIPKRWIRENGPDLVIDEQAGFDARIRAFFTRYQREFSWGREGRQSALEWIAKFEGLPEKIKLYLREIMGRRFPQHKLAEEHALDWFLASRYVGYHGEQSVMPVVELINHLPTADYIDTRDGVRVRGMYADEVSVRYNMDDSLQCFFEFGFVSPELWAFSLPVTVRNVYGTTLIVRTETKKRQGPVGVQSHLPTLESTDQGIVISHLLMGHALMPQLPRSIFRRILSGFSPEQADEVFQIIARINIRLLLKLLDDLEGHEEPICQELRAVVRLQLSALAESFGARDLATLPILATRT